ncbi:hypothetical protein [Comamonas testosteroni]|uniref:hypothetical protein n=1 Tax=Comamonas testosteroni TaxID=285 RepID=UPI0012FF36D0|nr:hypothetical protein [Comamonas testosteroni]
MPPITDKLMGMDAMLIKVATPIRQIMSFIADINLLDLDLPINTSSALALSYLAIHQDFSMHCPQ